jgi:predicted exporter
MTAITARRPASGRLPVLVLYGGLVTQIAEFAAYSAARLPTTVNLAQFACIAVECAAWTGLRRATRELAGHRGRPLDEREAAIRDRAAWITMRLLTLGLAVLAGGYVLLHEGTGWLPVPSAQWLGMIAFAAWMVAWTLPSAVLAWTQPAPLTDQE